MNVNLPVVRVELINVNLTRNGTIKELNRTSRTLKLTVPRARRVGVNSNETLSIGINYIRK